MGIWLQRLSLTPGGAEPRWREALLLWALLCVTFLACFQPVWDPDTFWHLAVGREVWDTHRLNRTDSFSFTAQGASWVDEEWLFQLLMYPLWKWGGGQAAAMCTGLAGALVVALVYRCTRLCGGGALTLAPYLLVLMECFRERVRFRPDLASLILMPILLEALLRWKPRPPHPGRLWLFLAPLFCLWAQLHAGWAYGMALVAAFLAGETFDAWKAGSLSFPYLARLVLTGLAPVGALFINPYGWKIPWFPIASLKGFASPEIVQVQEWMRTPLSGVNLLFLAAVLLLVVAHAWEWRSLSWKEAFWFGSQAVLGFLWLRYVAYAVAMLAPFTARPLNLLVRRAPLALALWGTSLAGCVAGATYYSTHLPKTWDLSALYPVQEVAFLRKNGVQGNVLHPFSVGGYLDLYGYPDLRVIMDGRYYPFLRILDDYSKAHRSLADFHAFLGQPSIDICIYQHSDALMMVKADRDSGAPPRGPTSLLIPDDTWALVYFGNFGMVFLRRVEKFEPVIRSFEYKVLRPDDLRYLAWEVQQGRLDGLLLREEILRKLKEDPNTARSAYLQRALAALDQAHTPENR